MVHRVGMVGPRPAGRARPRRVAERATGSARSAGAAGRAREQTPPTTGSLFRLGEQAAGRRGVWAIGASENLYLSLSIRARRARLPPHVKPELTPKSAAKSGRTGNFLTIAIEVPPSLQFRHLQCPTLVP